MKKNFLLTVLVALFSFLTATAQDDNKYNVVITMNNGTTITLGANDVDEITFNDGELTVTGETITALADKTTELATAIEDIQKTLVTLSDGVTEKGEMIDQLTRVTDLLDQRLSNYAGKVEDNVTRIEALEEAIAQLQAAVEELKNNGGDQKNLPEFVDLGLSVKWASYNIGATKATEVGGYYAWGELETKDNYSASTYKFYDEDWEEVKTPGRFDTTTYSYHIGGDAELDVVTATYGEGYRMPTAEEAKELFDNCEFEWVEEDGQRCAKFTAANGNYILLPANSYMQGSNLRAGTFMERCYYWTADTEDEAEDTAQAICIYNTTKSFGNVKVYQGCLIRAVQP